MMSLTLNTLSHQKRFLWFGDNLQLRARKNPLELSFALLSINSVIKKLNGTALILQKVNPQAYLKWKADDVNGPAFIYFFNSNMN